VTCDNCGDGSGWNTWYTRRLPTKFKDIVWVACADCNDDDQKRKPTHCLFCQNTRPYCTCENYRQVRVWGTIYKCAVGECQDDAIIDKGEYCNKHKGDVR